MTLVSCGIEAIVVFGVPVLAEDLVTVAFDEIVFSEASATDGAACFKDSLMVVIRFVAFDGIFVIGMPAFLISYTVDRKSVV